MMRTEAARLRDLAAWYRAFAERAGNPAIWLGRLSTAEDLEVEASRIEGARRAGPAATSGAERKETFDAG